MKHQWKRKSNGSLDNMAWDSHDHSGYKCECCGLEVCSICLDVAKDIKEYPNYIMDNCPGKDIYNKERWLLYFDLDEDD